MDILIVGSGGREYSIGLALQKDEKVDKLYFAPGNGATNTLGTNVLIDDFNDLADFANSNNIGLTIVGPEAPLVDGIVDIFRAKNLTIFGSSKDASKLEGSKIFMKEFLARHNIPTAKFIQTSDVITAHDFIDTMQTPIVVKADGLCAGKGVIIALSHEEARNSVAQMLSGESFGDAGTSVVIEEFLDGYELSVFAICDGNDYVVLPAAQDHKRLLDGDKGPNTGGMGAYAPTPLIDEVLYKKVNERVIEPTLEGMKSENMPFEGVLFIGLMIVNNEPIVLEYNVRFGDPECEILMPLIESSAFDLFYKSATKDIKNLKLSIKEKYAVGVVMASENYPFGSSKPAEILIDESLDERVKNHTHISFAGVSEEDGKLFATGGRVLLSVAVADSIKEARELAYMRCGDIHYVGKKLRMDIAYQALQS